MYRSIFLHKHKPFIRLVSVFLLLVSSTFAVFAQVSPSDFSDDDIVMVETEDRVVYEYRQNGVLMMIKVVPKKGKAYYMVPADGSAHFESLDHKKSLYPQWVLLEW